MQFLKLYHKLDQQLLSTKHFFLSLVDPVCWVVDKSSNSILDVACGRGMPMMVLKHRKKFKYSVGVDMFEPYLRECKRKKVHNEYVKADVRKLPFKDKSFDVVMALQILEHLEKKEVFKVLKKLERIARKQVIISTPIGRTYHSAVDNNNLQLHKSGFMPRDFEKLGYKIVKMGIRSIQDESGLTGKYTSELAQKLLYTLVLLFTPFLYIFQDRADWYFVAHKSMASKNDD